MRLVPFLLLAVQALFVLAAPLATRNVDYYDPRLNNGSMLDTAALNKTTGALVGEPLNVIISGKSSPEVLTTDGIVNYARAIGFSVECLGMHIGVPQTANLGDGNGDVPQSAVLREAYGVPSIGACWESLVGGNHFRVFRQNGPKGNSGALFLAVSREMDAPIHHHMIVPNGYNIGRDKMVAAAVGVKSYGKYRYNTTVTDIPDLMDAGTKGVNHVIAVDGVVKLLIVTIIE
jgi:hypothetical protein